MMPHDTQPPRAILVDEDTLNTAELLAIIRRIPAYTRVVYALYRDTRVPHWQKVMLTAAIGYLVSPVDLVPGIIPVAGQLDDIVIALALLAKVVRSLPEAETRGILAQSGLSREILENDLREATWAAKYLARKAGRAVKAGAKLLWKGTVVSSRALWKGGRALHRMAREGHARIRSRGRRPGGD